MKKARRQNTFFALCRRFSAFLIGLTLLGVLTSVVGVWFAFASKTVIDVAAGQAYGNVFSEIARLLALVLAQLILEILNSRLYMITAGKIEMYLRADLFASLLKKQTNALAQVPTGELLNRINSDTSVVVSAVADIIPTAVALSVRLALSLAALFLLDKTLAIFCLILAPFLFLAGGVFRKRLKHLHKGCLECEGKIRSFLIEAFTCITVIKSFVKENFFAKRMEELQQQSFAKQKEKNTFSIMTATLFFAAVTLGYYAALGWGAYRISLGLMTFGTLTAVLELIGQVESPVRTLSSLIPQWFAASASLERMESLQTLASDAAARDKAEFSGWESIDFSRVSFSYGETSILNNFSTSIQRGSVVTVAGASGTGKSTLFKLLLGFEKAQSGEIVLKKKDGTVCALDSGARCLFAYVPQVNFLMSGTLAQNIAFGEVVKPERLEKCAKQAELWELVQSLPQGFHTKLGENGYGLSEGEGQRVAVARALYADAEVLLMDEGTSALDGETEQRVLENLKSLHKTVILISHREGAFAISDRTIDLGRREMST